LAAEGVAPPAILTAGTESKQRAFRPAVLFLLGHDIIVVGLNSARQASAGATAAKRSQQKLTQPGRHVLDTKPARHGMGGKLSRHAQRVGGEGSAEAGCTGSSQFDTTKTMTYGFAGELV